MTLAIDPTVAAALASAGTSNNPIIAYDNAAIGATLTTTTGTQVEAASNAYDPATNTAWVVTADGSGNAILQIVLGAAQSLSFAAIVAHNIGTLGGSVRIEYSTNSGGVWNDCGAGIDTPSDDSAMGWYFDSVSADYWRVSVSGVGASSEVTIGVALISTPITLGQRFYQGYSPPITPTNVALQSNISDGGHFMGSAVVRSGSGARASLSEITPTFLRGATWKGFQSHFNDGDPFFFAWRPTKYEDLFYAWRRGDVIRPENSGPKDYMSFTMDMGFYDDP